MANLEFKKFLLGSILLQSSFTVNQIGEDVLPSTIRFRSINGLHKKRYLKNKEMPKGGSIKLSFAVTNSGISKKSNKEWQVVKRCDLIMTDFEVMDVFRVGHEERKIVDDFTLRFRLVAIKNGHILKREKSIVDVDGVKLPKVVTEYSLIRMPKVKIQKEKI